MASEQSKCRFSVWTEISTLLEERTLLKMLTNVLRRHPLPAAVIFLLLNDLMTRRGIINEGVQFSYAAPPYPYLNQVRNLKANPNIASKDEILGVLLEQPWRFDEPADSESQFSSKSIGIDDPLGFVDLNKSISGSAYQDGLFANWRRNQNLADGNKIDFVLWLHSTPRECIDWQDQCPEGSGPHIIPVCSEPVDAISGRVIDGYVQGAEVFILMPTGRKIRMSQAR